MTAERESPIRVLLIDDHPLLRTGLAQLIDREDDMEVCGEAEDAREALKQIEALQPDLATVDITLPGRSGTSLIKDIRTRFPDLPMLVVSMHDESLYAERAIRAGARGYINKQEATRKVIGAIRRVLKGEIYLSERFASRLMSRLLGGKEESGTAVDRLSDRELEVFQLIGQGLETRAIAETLHLSVKTIETHRARIKQKLELRSTTELALHAIRWTQEQSSG